MALNMAMMANEAANRAIEALDKEKEENEAKSLAAAVAAAVGTEELTPQQLPQREEQQSSAVGQFSIPEEWTQRISAAEAVAAMARSDVERLSARLAVAEGAVKGLADSGAHPAPSMLLPPALPEDIGERFEKLSSLVQKLEKQQMAVPQTISASEGNTSSSPLDAKLSTMGLQLGKLEKLLADLSGRIEGREAADAKSQEQIKSLSARVGEAIAATATLASEVAAAAALPPPGMQDLESQVKDLSRALSGLGQRVASVEVAGHAPTEMKAALASEDVKAQVRVMVVT